MDGWKIGGCTLARSRCCIYAVTMYAIARVAANEGVRVSMNNVFCLGNSIYKATITPYFK